MRNVFFKWLLAGSVMCAMACQTSTTHQGHLLSYPLVPMPSPASGDKAGMSSLFTAANGQVYLSWLEQWADSAALKFSHLQDTQWSAPITVVAGTNWFKNWADFSSLAADTSGHLMAHYLPMSDTGKYTYDVFVTFSNNGGRHWTPGKVLHDDGIKAEHGFVTIVPYNNQFFVTWLDGRNTATPHQNHGHAHHHGGEGAMTLRAALFSKAGQKVQEWELDHRICDCCQTTAGITANGPIVVYRDRSDNEIRDMSIVRFENGSWTPPQTLWPHGWKTNACPVNGPKLDVLANKVVVAMFSAPNDSAQVSVVFSNDGGKNFGEPIRIDEGRAVGRVDVAWLNETTAAVSWMEGEAIKLVTVSANGNVGESRTLVNTSGKRASGFPQMTKSGHNLYFSWTDAEVATIKTARLPLPQ